jgi:uncharacterized membrane protein YheB (UPF0754 family)
MKNILLLLPFIIFNVHAESVDETIGNACLKQAVSFTQQLKADVYTDMDRQQASKIIQLSTESCKQQFAAKENREVVADVNEEMQESKSTDWFTQKILSGDTTRKSGNERLKRLQRK